MKKMFLVFFILVFYGSVSASYRCGEAFPNRKMVDPFARFSNPILEANTWSFIAELRTWLSKTFNQEQRLEILNYMVANKVIQWEIKGRQFAQSPIIQGRNFRYDLDFFVIRLRRAQEKEPQLDVIELLQQVLDQG